MYLYLPTGSRLPCVASHSHMPPPVTIEPERDNYLSHTMVQFYSIRTVGFLNTKLPTGTQKVDGKVARGHIDHRSRAWNGTAATHRSWEGATNTPARDYLQTTLECNFVSGVIT